MATRYSAAPSLASSSRIALVLYCCAACAGQPDPAVRASLEDATTDPLAFYATHSPTTDPGAYTYLFDGVSADVAGIVQAVQAVMVRLDAAEHTRAIGRRRLHREVHIATVRGMLERIAELDNRPLTQKRAQQHRLVSICAQYAMLTTALLRHHGIPARARAGFEANVSLTRHHDHWITEFWDAGAARWVRVDAEIDAASRHRWGSTIDGLDLPRHTFLTGADAWRRCRLQGKPPTHFGIVSGKAWMGGWDFVLNSLLLDFNALNKIEALPWSGTVLGEKGHAGLTPRELSLLDGVAEAVVESDHAFGRVRQLFKSTPALRKSD